MSTSTFQRYEIKYLVNEEQRVLLERAFRDRMIPDPHGDSTICGIYYDTPDFRLIRHSLEKPVYKEKLRLRSFGTVTPTEEVYFELKKKYTITVMDFLIVTAAALVLGAIFALVYSRNDLCSKSFTVTLATLPAIVSLVIMMVSGSVGAGVAVAGTFSLVRFRSAPGSAKEVAAVFTAMALGLACGMGCPGLAALFTAIICIVDILYAKTGFGEKKTDSLCKTLSITVPEDLEYADIFSDLFEKYAADVTLVRVKTTNLDSLNKLTYNLTLLKSGCEKAFIDELRCRNGNLEISLSEQST